MWYVQSQSTRVNVNWVGTRCVGCYGHACMHAGSLIVGQLLQRPARPGCLACEQPGALHKAPAGRKTYFVPHRPDTLERRLPSSAASLSLAITALALALRLTHRAGVPHAPYGFRLKYSGACCASVRSCASICASLVVSAPCLMRRTTSRSLSALGPCG